jgi:hypothetical protein
VKFLRLDAVNAALGGWPVIVLGVLTASCGVANGVLGFVILRERYDVAAVRPGLEAAWPGRGLRPGAGHPRAGAAQRHGRSARPCG